MFVEIKLMCILTLSVDVFNGKYKLYFNIQINLQSWFIKSDVSAGSIIITTSSLTSAEPQIRPSEKIIITSSVMPSKSSEEEEEDNDDEEDDDGDDWEQEASEENGEFNQTNVLLHHRIFWFQNDSV